MVEEKADAGIATKQATWPGTVGARPKEERAAKMERKETKAKVKTQIEP